MDADCVCWVDDSDLPYCRRIDFAYSSNVLSISKWKESVDKCGVGANDRPLFSISISCVEKEYELRLCVIWNVRLVLILPLKKLEFSFVLWLDYVV